MRIHIIKILLKLFRLEKRNYLVLVKEEPGMRTFYKQIVGIPYNGQKEYKQALLKLELFVKKKYPKAAKKKVLEYELPGSIDTLHIEKIEYTIQLLPNFQEKYK